MADEVTEEQHRGCNYRVRANEDWRAELFAPGMNFSAFGELVIRPGFLLHRGFRNVCIAGTRGDGIVLRGDIPVLGRVGDSPHVSVIVESTSDEKAVIAQRKAVSHARSDGSTAREIVDHDRRFELESAGTAETASRCARHQDHATLGEWAHAVQTRDTYRNLYAQARAASGRLGRENFHKGRIVRNRQNFCQSDNLYCCRFVWEGDGDFGNW